MSIKLLRAGFNRDGFKMSGFPYFQNVVLSNIFCKAAPAQTPVISISNREYLAVAGNNDYMQLPMLREI